MRWILFCLAWISAISITSGKEELVVQHAPKYMEFVSNDDKIKGSEFIDVASAALGFSSKTGIKWSGLKASSNPFEKPKAILVVEEDGFSKVNLKLNKISYPLDTDMTPGRSYEQIVDRITRRYENSVTTMEIAMESAGDTLELLTGVRVSSLKEDLFSKASILSGKRLTSLNTSLTADEGFLLDLQLFSEVADSLQAGATQLRDSATPDFFWFRTNALQGVISEYGVDSPQVAEAIELIRFSVKEIESRFSKIYGDNYLYFVLTVDNQCDEFRARRNLLELSTPSPSVEWPSAGMNLSPEYDENYPAIFNIIFFVMLIIGLSVFAVALGMWHIDPGRDSIIYRMTSQRIKKEQ